MRFQWRQQPVYYGWAIVGALAVTETISCGVLYYAFAVFMVPIQAELGWSQVAITGAFSLALALSGLAAVPVGRWLDRRGARLLMTAGSCVAALLVLAWASVSQLTTFYAIWAGIGLCMATLLYEPAFAVVTQWFVRQRSRALAIITFVAAFASTIFAPLSAWLIGAYGWRTALVILAIVLAAGTIPLHALVLRRRPQDLGLALDGGAAGAAVAGHTSIERSTSLHAALRGHSFWWLTGAFMLTNLAAIATTVHLVAYLTSRGYGAGFAATATGLIGAMKLPGRLLFAPLDARFSRRTITTTLFGLQGLALLVLLFAPGTAGVLVFVALFGGATGATTLARPALLAEFYGPLHYASISGVLALALAGAQALAPVSAGALRAGLGGYEPVFILLAVLSLAAAGAIFLADAAQQRDLGDYNKQKAF